MRFGIHVAVNPPDDCFLQGLVQPPEIHHLVPDNRIPGAVHVVVRGLRAVVRAVLPECFSQAVPQP
ncbi:MAG: hypothetical protein V5A84_03825, partial [Planctomycetota bacterium]